MTFPTTPLPEHLTTTSRLGDEISVTGKWVPKKQGGRFRTSEESREMLAEWEDIHLGARSSEGVLSTEINHAVGEDAVLIHHVFEDAAALTNYFETTASEHMSALSAIATPRLHIVRGAQIPADVRATVLAKKVPSAFGEYLFGYVKDDSARPDPATAIAVTARWNCTTTEGDTSAELKHWWQKVGTDAYTLEKGLVRFEAYVIDGGDALIIHEVFSDTAELKFHLTKGTAARYKANLDAIAAPDAYYFRGPVSWTIRTYSKFMHLPATYSTQGSAYTRPGGSMSDGLLA